MCTCIHARLCTVYAWVYAWVRVCVCTSLYECIYIMCAWLRVAAITDSFVQSELGNESFRLCSLWAWYTGGSKIDPWDNSEVCTDSCSEDQTAIWIKNHVISCESLLCVVQTYYWSWVFIFMLFLYLLLSVVFICFSYYFMWTIDIFYLYDFMYHFMRYQ